MDHPQKAALFWSGGKDSALALYLARQNPEIEVTTLVCTLNESYRRISLHGIREEVLDRQVAQTGLALMKMWVPDSPDNSVYETELLKIYADLKKQGISLVVYGDIFLEDLRIYREKLLDEVGLKGYFPLWKQETGQLIREFLALGFKTVICCISTDTLTESCLGRLIDNRFLEELPPSVDPCGENGEFHTFCFAGPIFKEEVRFHTGEKHYSALQLKTLKEVKETGFWYLDIL
ncbi:MAG TPA: diphthine--ammonia ligase [Daejeonella sp.]|nr:diphthine--ammonia ligase [Daejeonella sp.]